MLSRCTSAITVLVSPSSVKMTLLIDELVRLIDLVSQRRRSQHEVCYMSPVSRWGRFFCSFVCFDSQSSLPEMFMPQWGHGSNMPLHEPLERC